MKYFIRRDIGNLHLDVSSATAIPTVQLLLIVIRGLEIAFADTVLKVDDVIAAYQATMDFQLPDVKVSSYPSL